MTLDEWLAAAPDRRIARMVYSGGLMTVTVMQAGWPLISGEGETIEIAGQLAVDRWHEYERRMLTTCSQQ